MELVISVAEQALGALLTLTTLLDVFLTVLYPRLDSGFISYWLAVIIRWCFTALASFVKPRYRGNVMSFCGPVVVVATVLFWSFSLALGAALLFHPNLGSSIVSGDGPTAGDFSTALFAGGSSVSIIAASELRPANDLFRMIFL